MSLSMRPAPLFAEDLPEFVRKLCPLRRLHELLGQPCSFPHIAALRGLRCTLKCCGVLRGDHLCGLFAVRRAQRGTQLLYGVLPAGLRCKAAEDFILIGHWFPSLSMLCLLPVYARRGKNVFSRVYKRAPTV